MQITASTLAAALGNITSNDGAFAYTNNVFLAQQIVDKGLATVPADITPATGGMRANAPVVAWHGPFVLSDGSSYYQTGLLTWTPDGPEDAQTIIGWFITGRGFADQPKGYGVFPQPIQVTDETTPINMVLRLVLAADGQWSAEQVF